MNYEYYSDEYGFTFLFKRKNYDKINKQNDKINDKINIDDDKKKANLDESIVQLISENNTITIPVIAKKLRKSEATIYRHIKSMIESSVLLRVGARKTGYWKIL